MEGREKDGGKGVGRREGSRMEGRQYDVKFDCNTMLKHLAQRDCKRNLHEGSLEITVSLLTTSITHKTVKMLSSSYFTVLMNTLFTRRNLKIEIWKEK